MPGNFLDPAKYYADFNFRSKVSLESVQDINDTWDVIQNDIMDVTHSRPVKTDGVTRLTYQEKKFAADGLHFRNVFELKVLYLFFILRFLVIKWLNLSPL